MTSFSIRKQSIGLLGWLVASFVVLTLASIASVQARSFYGQLTQPDWAPPGWLFGPVWTTLYVLMAVAAWLVWREGGFGRQARALGLFATQLVFNALWSWLFFAWKLGGLALADLIVLWVLIALTVVAFWRVRILAGILLLPYLAWVSFAGFLNFSVWQLNPALL